MKNLINKFLNNNLRGKNKKFNDIKLFEIVLSLMFIIFGIILLLNKTLSDNFITIFLGIIVIIDALINVYSFFAKNSNSLFKVNIVFGILYFLIAVLFFTNFINFLNYLSIYFGSYLIVSGLKDLIISFRLKLVREDSYLIIFVMSLLVIALGVLVVFYPFESFGSIEILSIFAILYGLLNINTSNLLRNRVDKFLSKVDND